MADNNIIIRITSEADLDSAQKQLQELTNRAREQERALSDSSVYAFRYRNTIRIL